jgi:hypothetical protein
VPFVGDDIDKDDMVEEFLSHNQGADKLPRVQAYHEELADHDKNVDAKGAAGLLHSTILSYG